MGTNTSSVRHESTSPTTTEASDEDAMLNVDMEFVVFDEDDDWVKVEVEEATSEHVFASGCSDTSCGTTSASVTLSAEDREDVEGGAMLDEAAFPCFAQLLSASQAYASQSGCRFRGSDFYDLPRDEGSVEATACPRLAAKQQAAPTVAHFAARLRSCDQELVEEMDGAYEVVMNESIRNAMVAGFRELGLWPPVPTPPGIADCDCNFEEMSAPIPVIAQRAYNDERQRRQDAALGGGSAVGRSLRHATTASYLVDFGYESGMNLPSASSGSRHVSLLQAFGDRVDQWKNEVASLPLEGLSPSSNSPVCTTCDDFASSGGGFEMTGLTFDELGLDAAKWWSHCWREAVWALTSTVFLGATASAGISLLNRSIRSEMKVHGSGEVMLEDEACNESNGELEVMQMMGRDLEAM